MEPIPQTLTSVVAHELGIYWRDPVTKLERFLMLFFREFRWARRILGGRWELVVHDMGTDHYVLSWFWVTRWTVNKGSYHDNLIGRESYLRGRRLRYDP